MKRKYSATVRAKAESMLAAGVRPYKVAADLKLPISAIAYWNKKITPSPKGDSRVADALVFLRHGQKDLMNSIRNGTTKHPSRAELHMLLALDSLGN